MIRDTKTAFAAIFVLEQEGWQWSLAGKLDQDSRSRVYYFSIFKPGLVFDGNGHKIHIAVAEAISNYNPQ